MALLQISEPGQATAPHQHRLAVGIDLGTTHSLVASVRSGSAATLPDEQGCHLLPSVVRYREDGNTQVGLAAVEQAVQDPSNTIFSVKRLMGKGMADLGQTDLDFPYEFVDSDSAMPRLRTVAADVSPVEVSAEILTVLKQRAEQTLGGELVGAVITVPAYFDDAQRQATKDAARIAGLNVFRLLNEPTAAAVAYGLDRESQGVIAVYDLGGGTFDISILRLNKGIFEVMSTAGDTALGGDDFDRAIALWALEQAGARSSSSPQQMRSLLQAARKAKHSLGEHESAKIEFKKEDGELWHGELTRELCNELMDPFIKKTLHSCRKALRDAGITTEDVNDVVMVGGSTRALRVRERVQDYFGRELMVDIDPDTVVALGAAVQADILAGNKPDEDMLLLDVIPLSLGMETMGGLVEKIIPRNTTIPVTRAQEFTTFKDGQTAISVHVLQGERELVSDNRSLAHFELRDIPPMVAGAARIRVTFQVDADGLLGVTAEETTSGAKTHVEVKPSYGLTDTEIESMLKDSLQHAGGDMQARALREQQVEADRVIEAIRAALSADGEQFLSSDERDRIERSLQALEKVRDGEDHRSIKRAIEALEKASALYVERRMNSSIKQAMAGHGVDEFE